MAAHDEITFGFSEIVKATDAGEPPKTPADTPSAQPKAYKLPERNVGLGAGPGGQMARSYLGSTGASVLANLELQRRKVDKQQVAPEPAFELQGTAGPSEAFSLNDGPEPQGMFMGLLLNEEAPASELDLQAVREHRWTFYGAEDLARQGKSYCYFIWCLLDLQRNVQLEEDGDALDQRLAKACRTFVCAQCRQGKMGSMYQLLTHFISNAAVFYEWSRFLNTAFLDERAGQEDFLVPHLDQVWSRFCRFRTVLEGIFDVLNSRFVWRHRLPAVSALVHEHMKRRCFSTEAVMKNELICQAASRNETIKQVKYAFGIQ